MTLTEVLVGSAVSVMVAGALFASVSTLNRTYSAADHYATSQASQARVTDFLDVDLRRATSYSQDSSGNITLSIPGFYNPSGVPRMPSPQGRFADYGSPSEQVTVTYRNVNGSIIRTETRPDRLNGVIRTVLARGVTDFETTLSRGRQTVQVRISFRPRFSWFTSTQNAARQGTTFTSHTFLRNIRDVPAS